jgi:hypothetical protein
MDDELLYRRQLETCLKSRKALHQFAAKPEHHEFAVLKTELARLLHASAEAEWANHLAAILNGLGASVLDATVAPSVGNEVAGRSMTEISLESIDARLRDLNGALTQIFNDLYRAGEDERLRGSREEIISAFPGITPPTES